jgi:radical SAM/Cys-rich protein
MLRRAVKIRPAAEGSFEERLRTHGLWPLRRGPLRELQVNIGRRCNQACSHCHVDAGPKRPEVMSWETMEKILAWSRAAGITAADITGGAPEIHPHFRRFVDGFLALGAQVTARCNLTVLLEPGQDDLANWYATRRIRLVASLPCYTQKNVDAQRGDGVFEKSLEALRRLNAAGYGRDERLPLDLVYNPGGAFLPGAQEKLEADYKRHLFEEFGIQFTHLRTLTNLPINRFAHFLKRTGQQESYQQLLEDNFNPATVPGLMCRHLLSVDWRGFVYDCDFNQMLDLPLAGGIPQHLWDIRAEELADLPVAVDRHCFGCTAGAGSSCGGALVSANNRRDIRGFLPT